MTMDEAPPRWNQTVLEYISEGLRAGAKVALLVPKEALARYIGLLEDFVLKDEEFLEDGTVAFIPSEILMTSVRDGGPDPLQGLGFIEDLCEDAKKDGWPIIYIFNGAAMGLAEEELALAYRLEQIWGAASRDSSVVTLCLYREKPLKEPGRLGLLVALTSCHNQFIRALPREGGPSEKPGRR